MITGSSSFWGGFLARSAASSSSLDESLSLESLEEESSWSLAVDFDVF
jgi:hypothetical protein